MMDHGEEKVRVHMHVDQYVANPIIYRLVPSPSRFEIRQLSHTKDLREF